MSVCVCGWTATRKDVLEKNQKRAQVGVRDRSLELLSCLVICRRHFAIPRESWGKTWLFRCVQVQQQVVPEWRNSPICLALDVIIHKLIALHGWRDQFIFTYFYHSCRPSFPILIHVSLSTWHCRRSFQISCGLFTPSRNRKTAETFSRIRIITPSNCFYVC